ncbi:ABC transporter permease [Massilia sp. H-1]|nr:ABC transporter permease [Massilia sp. H-1]
MELAMITDTVRLARRLIRAQLKKPFYILLSVSQPLMYLVFFGAMFSNMPGMSQDQQSYIYFLTPGMVVMAALFGSAYLSALAPWPTPTAPCSTASSSRRSTACRSRCRTCSPTWSR